MFVRNLFQLKGISYKIKVITLTVVGVAFLFVLFFSIWNQYYVDTLIAFTPESSVLYVHFSLPKMKQSQNFNNLLSDILVDFGLKDFDLQLVKREVAIIGQLKDNRLVYSAIIRTDNQPKLKSYLNEQEIDYNFLDGSRVLISTADTLSDFVKNRDNRVIRETKGKFNLLTSLKIYSNPGLKDFLTDDLIFGVFDDLLERDDENIYLNFNLRRDGSLVLGRSSKKSSGLSEINDFDFVLSQLSGDNQLNSWIRRLESIATEDYFIWHSYQRRLKVKYKLDLDSDFISALISSDKVILARANQNSFWGYDLYLKFKLDSDLSPDEERELIGILQSFLANKFPTNKMVYLSDGTRVNELMPDPSQFEPVSLDSDSIFVLSAPAGEPVLFYRLDGGEIEIGTNRELLERPNQEFGDFMSIKTNVLPFNEIWQYIYNFNQLEYSDSGILFR